MGKYSSGRFALRISDRSGMAFPYTEMVQEWNRSWVHTSEFEPKQPQLDPKNHPTDFTALEHARPQIADATVYVGNDAVRSNVNIVAEGDYNDVGDGTAVNSFQTLEEAVTLYYANGVSYASVHRSMMPLGLQQPQRTTGLLSRTGNVTVSTS